ncbi:MAG: WXG100 family type VII secretion target [Lachnospiraceae bacterium]|nr:WXG100 family type VII secretion target [Lachnospiraceae bacterium]
MEFTVDTTKLASAVSSLESEIETLRTEYSQLYSVLEVLDGMWSGEARDAYVATYAEDMERINQMIQVIRSMVDDIGTARESYDSTEQSVQSSINKIVI